jgi:Na+-driven multidrug efflux pump
VVLAVVMPFGVPLAFGSTFRGSVAPATALFGSVLLYSSQTILVRAEAARGRSVLSAWSYGASVVVMITLDALLIPGMGITGAVLASTVGQATGFVIAATTFGRHHAGWRARDLVPGRRDVATVRSLIGSYRRR